MPHLGPIETMAYAAACTERLRLGCMMLVSPLILLNPLFDEAEQMERLAAEVVPQLR